jgi:tetratricopeptide (TPR) repeat protein
MKYLLMVVTAAVFSFFGKQEITKPSKNAREFFLKKKITAISCAPLRDRSVAEQGIGLLPGTGKHHWKIKTTSDSAQLYFDQGMNLYYSFHIIESLASFIKAQSFDNGNPMLYWAEALAYGPNINDLGYTQSPEALKAVQNASRLAGNATSVEKGLIAAMVARYSDEPTATREKLNTAYRDAMAGLYRSNPGNAEVIALYADALMVMHPWDLYEGNGEPKAWTPELVDVLEKGLKTDPLHPGLNHYYIHAVEGSRDPARGMASADKLGSIVPSAAHMVHMPSHIYIRTGHYSKGIDVNVAALKGYESYLGLYPAASGNPFIYQFHNTHMMAACAIMNGNSVVAMKSAGKCHDDIPADMFTQPPPFNEMIQYIYAAPIFAMVRYGKWNEMISYQVPDSLHFFKILDHFGKGIAYARTGKTDQAEKTLREMSTLMEQDSILKIRAFNTAYDAAVVAKLMLEGIIAEQKGELDKAESALNTAAVAEERMVYNEPKDWLLPPLQYLGQVQLKQGKYKEAESTFRKDLAFNPNNCWALKGLHMALEKQGRSKESSAVKTELTKAMKGADVKVEYAVY